jgi:hypothetical protein
LMRKKRKVGEPGVEQEKLKASAGPKKVTTDLIRDRHFL